MSRSQFSIHGDHASTDHGFGPELELFTTDGTKRIDAFTPGEQVLAMEPTSRLVKPKPMRSVERIPSEEPLVPLAEIDKRFTIPSVPY